MSHLNPQFEKPSVDPSKPFERLTDVSASEETTEEWYVGINPTEDKLYMDDQYCLDFDRLPKEKFDQEHLITFDDEDDVIDDFFATRERRIYTLIKNPAVKTLLRK